MDATRVMAAGYFIVIFLMCSRPACGICPDKGFQLINICRRPQEDFTFTMGSIRLHPRDLQLHLSMCVCQLTVDGFSPDLQVTRRHHPVRQQLFDIYILTPHLTANASNVSFNSIRKPIDEDGPWSFVVKKRNSSRSADDDPSEYCFSLRAEKTTISLHCETFPHRTSESTTQVVQDEKESFQIYKVTTVSVTVLASCLMGVAVACFVAGVVIAYCCFSSSRLRVRNLKGETTVCQFRDSGIHSSNLDNQHIAEEVDTSSEYATVDCRKYVNGVREDVVMRMTTLKTTADTDKRSLVTMENDLYE